MAEVSFADKLCNASACGKLDDVLFLLDTAGANVNGFNSFNRTAVQVAQLGNTALVETLLMAGADPNVPDPVLNLTVIHDAAREGFLQTVRVLLDHGADPNLVDGHGNLPLHLAAREGYLDVVRLLIESTANPRATNNYGLSAGELAYRYGKSDVFNFIQEYLS
ncbi:cyclin-dependent kinase 4 inhibitor C [Halichoeres trimaculatus]|uniref:cyclin-dependent kinase 4 inhibitor C n=1 Tax=Halichoeres trimaculatus TaxID=147232 RepID=UPI003D9DD885